MNGRRIVSNLLILGSSHVATWIMSGFFLILISHYLGPDRLGELMLAQSVVAILGLLVGLGMDTWITRTISRQPERGTAIVSAALVVRGLLAIPVPVVILVYAHLVHLNAETAAATYIYAAGMIFAQLSSVLGDTFQAHERMSFVAAGSVVFNVVGICWAALAVSLHVGIIIFAIASSFNFLLQLLLNAYWARPFVHITRSITVRDMRDVIAGSLAFWANNLFQTYYTYIDSVILASLAGSQAVGFYSPATRIYTMSMFLPGIVATVTLPQLSRLGIRAGSDFADAGGKTISLLIVCSVPVTIGLVTFAGPAVNTIFGTAYERAVPVLMILAVCIPFTYLNIAFYQLLAARDQQMRWSIIMGVSCIVNPLINLALIPIASHHWHNPSIGAALSLLVTEGLMTAYGAALLQEVSLHRLVGRAIPGALIGGMAQGGFLWFVGSQPLIVMVPEEAIGALAYMAIAIMLGALPRTDVKFLYETALRRPERVAA